MATGEIQKVLGHLDEKTTSKYVKTDQRRVNVKTIDILNSLPSSSLNTVEKPSIKTG